MVKLRPSLNSRIPDLSCMWKYHDTDNNTVEKQVIISIRIFSKTWHPWVIPIPILQLADSQLSWSHKICEEYVMYYCPKFAASTCWAGSFVFLTVANVSVLKFWDWDDKSIKILTILLYRSPFPVHRQRTVGRLINHSDFRPVLHAERVGQLLHLPLETRWDSWALAQSVTAFLVVPFESGSESRPIGHQLTLSARSCRPTVAHSNDAHALSESSANVWQDNCSHNSKHEAAVRLRNLKNKYLQLNSRILERTIYVIYLKNWKYNFIFSLCKCFTIFLL